MTFTINDIDLIVIAMMAAGFCITSILAFSVKSVETFAGHILIYLFLSIAGILQFVAGFSAASGLYPWQ